jgi:hypothetical protein
MLDYTARGQGAAQLREEIQEIVSIICTAAKKKMTPRKTIEGSPNKRRKN